MEISKLFGLPAHPLLVHVPIVLIPLAALGALLIAARPQSRARWGTPTVAVAAVATVFSFLAAGSGETLQESVKRNAKLRAHTEIGDSMKWIALVFLLGLVADLLVSRAPSRGTLSAAIADHRAPLRLATRVLTVVLAVLATVWIVRVGHTGAKATWNGVTVRGG